MKIRLISLLIAIITVTCIFSGCKSPDTNKPDVTNEMNQDKTESALRIGCLKGPTGMGMSKLISDNKTSGKYDISDLYTEPQQILSSLIGRKLDIAAVPVNLAATLTKKTNGDYVTAAINTLGVLYVVERGDSIKSVSDLAGKKIAATGQASTPEYILKHILSKNNVSDTEINFFGDGSGVVAQLISKNADIAMLPEPSVTTVLTKDPSLRIALNLTEEWEKVCGGKTVQGCLVVSKDIITNHPEKLEEFLSDYRSSVKYVNENPADASKLIAEIGIVDNAAIAEKAIPTCNIVCIEGEEMISALTEFYTVLFEASPASIGGTMPDESYYYKK